jgi:hypothetical protein
MDNYGFTYEDRENILGFHQAFGSNLNNEIPKDVKSAFTRQYSFYLDITIIIHHYIIYIQSSFSKAINFPLFLHIKNFIFLKKLDCHLQ